MTATSRRRPTLCIFAIAALLAACGGGDDAAPPRRRRRPRRPPLSCTQLAGMAIPAASIGLPTTGAR